MSLIEYYISEDLKENPERPKTNKEKRMYNLKKTLGEDGIINYFKARAEQTKGFVSKLNHKTIKKLLELRVAHAN